MDRGKLRKEKQETTVRKLSALRRPASEISGVVCTANTLVDCYLRIRTERPRHVHTTISHARSQHLIGRHTRFAPPLHRSQRVELVGSRSSATMGHAGDHEEAKPVLLTRSHLGEDA